MDGKTIDLDAIEARAEKLCTDGVGAVEAVAVFRADVVALLDKVDELRAELSSAYEANRGMRAMEDRYREMADRYRRMADRYRRMADRYRDVVDQYRQENAELASASRNVLIEAAELFERDGRYTLPFDGIQVSAELKKMAREAMGESAPAGSPEAGTVDGGS